MCQTGRDAQQHVAIVDIERKIKSVEETQNALDRFFVPKENVIIDRFNFNNNQQKDG